MRNGFHQFAEVRFENFQFRNVLWALEGEQNNSIACWRLYTVQPEILAIFKFGGLVPSGRNKNIGGFKFGGSSVYIICAHAHA